MTLSARAGFARRLACGHRASTLRAMPAVRLPEVLAPAGDEACLRAAVGAGADAVYFGLQGMNARARATNFDEASLEPTLRFLHAHGVKGYVTLNTLAFDHELDAVADRIRVCARAGVDAIIVQDLAVAELARAIAPDLPVHASTQMTCTDVASVELAASLGARRVVVARELSILEIESIARGTEVELEVFVHGALCVAYSGQCLTSEALGGRSANRGACAQACRLPYELIVDGAVRPLGDRAYLLSPEDLEASAQVPALAAAGVRSLKIEGRMKGPEYVAATTRLYREAVDALVRGEGVARARVDAALQTYSRGSGPGFLTGVDHQRLVPALSCDHRGREIGVVQGTRMVGRKSLLDVNLSARLSTGHGLVALLGSSHAPLGGRVWGIEVDGRDRDDVEQGLASVWLGPDVDVEARASELRDVRLFCNDDPELDARVIAEANPSRRRVAADLHFTAELDEAPILSAQTGTGETAVILGAKASKADKRPTTREAIADALGELGDSAFSLRSLTIEIPDGAFVPLSEVKKARRALLTALEETTHRAHEVLDGTPRAFASSAPPLPPGLFVLCRTETQARAALAAGADGVYLDFLALTGAGATFRALKSEGAAFVGLAPPRIRKPGEEKIDRYLEGLKPDALLVRSLGSLFEGTSSGLARVGDFSLNVSNQATARQVLARGVGSFTPSFDLDAAQLLALLADPALAERAEVVLHHPMPLFHMEHCVFAALLSEGKDHRDCGRPCDRHAIELRDRAGHAHPVEADVGCRNTVFHAVPQSAASLMEQLREAGVARYRIELVREDAASVATLVSAYRALVDGTRTGKDVWRELKTPGGYGVVRGSLRVL